VALCLAALLCVPGVPARAVPWNPAGEPFVIVEGDSIAEGGQAPITLHLIYEIRRFLRDPDVVSVARGGKSLARLRPDAPDGAGIAAEWGPLVLDRDPAVIVLLTGANDILPVGDETIGTRLDRFAHLLREMLDAARDHVNPDGSRPAVILVSPPRIQDPAEVGPTPGPFTQSRARSDLEALVARERAVVQDHPEARWVNASQAWRDFNQARGGGTWFVTHLTADGVHPNGDGQRLLFLLLRPALVDALMARASQSGHTLGIRGTATDTMMMSRGSPTRQ
jgi:lysophospholipase L1-like esterase